MKLSIKNVLLISGIALAAVAVGKRVPVVRDQI